jgi:predicted DNA-binding transcriptional regulator YafY
LSVLEPLQSRIAFELTYDPGSPPEPPLAHALDRTERFYKVEMLIRNRGCVSFADLIGELGVSRATLKRDLEYLRARMDAPIVYDRFDNGYKLDADPRDQRQVKHELPGVWFSEREIHALLTMHQLIQGLHYRNTWYLDAWCHASDGPRRFALDAIREATLLEQRAMELAMDACSAAETLRNTHEEFSDEDQSGSARRDGVGASVRHVQTPFHHLGGTCSARPRRSADQDRRGRPVSLRSLGDQW